MTYDLVKAAHEHFQKQAKLIDDSVAWGNTAIDHINQLQAELDRFRPQPGTFTADEARALEHGELTIWFRDERTP